MKYLIKEFKMNRFEMFIVFWPQAWVGLIENIVWILTLGQYKPYLNFKYICSKIKRK